MKIGGWLCCIFHWLRNEISGKCFLTHLWGLGPRVLFFVAVSWVCSHLWLIGDILCHNTSSQVSPALAWLFEVTLRYRSVQAKCKKVRWKRVHRSLHLFVNNIKKLGDKYLFRLVRGLSYWVPVYLKCVKRKDLLQVWMRLFYNTWYFSLILLAISLTFFPSWCKFTMHCLV